MNRVYIASQILGTVHICDGVPVESRLFGGRLGTLIDEGPSVNNRQPPKMMATRLLRDLREHPYRYGAQDCEFLASADYGTWQKQIDGWKRIR
jgi:hypothetical protein